MSDVLRAVQAYADRGRSERAKMAPRGADWKASEHDGEVLRDVVLGLLDVLDGLRPWADLRRMFIALDRRDRGVLERRVRVVGTIRWALWIWDRTEDHPKRRLEVAQDVLRGLKEEHRAYGKLNRGDVMDMLTVRRKNVGAERVAARLSQRCGAFGDGHEASSYEAFRAALKKQRGA